MGWHVRRGLAGDLGADVPWIAAGLVVAGGVIATVVHFAIDIAIHRHCST